MSIIRGSFCSFFWTIWTCPGGKWDLLALAVFPVELLIDQLVFSCMCICVQVVALIILFVNMRRKVKIDAYFEVTPPLLPGGWQLISERRPQRSENRQKACRDMTRELVRESCHMADYLAVGKYQAITHEAVVSRLKQDAQIHICFVRPVFSATLHSILRMQTCGRCRRCAKRCPPWKAEPRQFNLVRFEKFEKKTTSEKHTSDP